MLREYFSFAVSAGELNSCAVSLEVWENDEASHLKGQIKVLHISLGCITAPCCSQLLVNKHDLKQAY